jgi:NAD(P)-dependent dehydrogenase (short-subunit alcohol dehydrogenase family)
MNTIPLPSLAVLGATGTIGSAVVAAALKAGQPVVAIAREADALAALPMRHPGADLTVIAASVGSDGEAAALARRLRDLARPLSGVVAAICGDCGRGRVLDQPAEFLRKRLDEDLLPHLFAARHLLPLLVEHGQGRVPGYVLIGGPGAQQPWAGYGHRSIGAAALRMLARVLHDEARAFPANVQLLAVDSPARTDVNARHACNRWPSADSIARRALDMLDPRERQPAQAVVGYAAAQPLGFDLWSDDIDHPAPASPGRSTSNPSLSKPATHGSRRDRPPPMPPQEPERQRDLLPARCLQDARTLLDQLGGPHPKSNQETSPR